MDREEFNRRHDFALRSAERMRTYFTNDEIILIMTADFYRELCTLVEVHANRDVDDYGTIYGYRIALINEPTECTMVSPAVLGMTYHPGMGLDDIIVVDDAFHVENRVFRLTNHEPVQFVDTGMTVRFNTQHRIIGLDVAAETMRVTTAQFGAIATTATATEENWQQYWTTPVTAAEVNHSVFDMLTGGGKRKKKRAKEDVELSAGDTKAMDEFLDGFAIKQNLQQA